MEGLKIEVAYSGTDINTMARCSYETVKIGACKTWYVIPHSSTKLDRNKGKDIPVHMHQGETTTKQLKDKGETPTVIVHSGQINKTTTLNLPNEEDWRQAT